MMFARLSSQKIFIQSLFNILNVLYKALKYAYVETRTQILTLSEVYNSLLCLA